MLGDTAVANPQWRRRLLAIALQRAKGRDGGKTNRRATMKSFLEIENVFSEELSTTFMGATRSFFSCQGSQNNGTSSPVTMPPPKTRCAQAQTNL